MRFSRKRSKPKLPSRLSPRPLKTSSTRPPKTPSTRSPKTPSTRSPQVSPLSPIRFETPAKPKRFFVDTPSSMSSDHSPLPGAFEFHIPASPVSPLVHRDANRRTLAQYHNLILDMCALTGTLFYSQRVPSDIQKRDMDELLGLLHKEKIRLDSRLPVEVLAHLRPVTFKVTTPAQMHRLLCKLGGKYRYVSPDGM